MSTMLHNLFSKLVNEGVGGGGGVKNHQNSVNVVYGCSPETFGACSTHNMDLFLVFCFV